MFEFMLMLRLMSECVFLLELGSVFMFLAQVPNKGHVDALSLCCILPCICLMLMSLCYADTKAHTDLSDLHCHLMP